MNTIPQLFSEAVARFKARPALIEPGQGNTIETLTYQELQERVHKFAGYLQQQHVNKGERIMIWASSQINWMVAYLGALLVGMTVVPLDVNSKEDFLERLVETTEARLLVTTQKQYQSLEKPPIPLIDIESLPQGWLDMAALPSIEKTTSRSWYLLQERQASPKELCFLIIISFLMQSVLQKLSIFGQQIVHYLYYRSHICLK